MASAVLTTSYSTLRNSTDLTALSTNAQQALGSPFLGLQADPSFDEQGSSDGLLVRSMGVAADDHVDVGVRREPK